MSKDEKKVMGAAIFNSEVVAVFATEDGYMDTVPLETLEGIVNSDSATVQDPFTYQEVALTDADRALYGQALGSIYMHKSQEWELQDVGLDLGSFKINQAGTTLDQWHASFENEEIEPSGSAFEPQHNVR